MNEDLKIIKNKYGEKMMHLCRTMFPTILETPGLLSNILLSHFEPTRFLYEDLQDAIIKEQFENYINNLANSKLNENCLKTNKTPKQLLAEVGYTLYECKNEQDVQQFKKYYVKGEEICSFEGGRLNKWHVFFAVKQNAEKLNRNSFINPQRQDEYGTSVISLQFSKDDLHTLSIKNRYNDKVYNADATFSNNLENIIPGLTESFERVYNLKQNYQNTKFNIPGYVLANDGKYYKYNKKINNIYYCPNNIIIDNLEVKRFELEKYIVLDYFILDLSTGLVTLYDKTINDCFPQTITNSKKVQVYKEDNIKKVFITKDNNENIVIVLDDKNNIIGYQNLSLKEIENDFLSHNSTLRKIEIPSVLIIGNNFLRRNDTLKEIGLSSVEKIGDNFLESDTELEIINAPHLIEVGNWFLSESRSITILDFASLKKVGIGFVPKNYHIEVINFPELEITGDNFLTQAVETQEDVIFPKLKITGNSFMLFNNTIKKAMFPNLEETGRDFMAYNNVLEIIYVPNLIMLPKGFLGSCNNDIRIQLINEQEENIYSQHQIVQTR